MKIHRIQPGEPSARSSKHSARMRQTSSATAAKAALAA